MMKESWADGWVEKYEKELELLLQTKYFSTLVVISQDRQARNLTRSAIETVR